MQESQKGIRSRQPGHFQRHLGNFQLKYGSPVDFGASHPPGNGIRLTLKLTNLTSRSLSFLWLDNWTMGRFRRGLALTDRK